MDEYVTRCTVTIDGQAMEDFKNFSDGARSNRAAVNLMNKTGFARKTGRYTFSLDYVIPASGAEFDFDSVENATVTVELEGGRRYLYTGVCNLDVGEAGIDGESEMVRTIDFGADNRRVE